MKITLLELQNIFGERIKLTLDNDKDKEEKEIEYEQTRMVLELGKQMINNADIIMRRDTLLAKIGHLEESKIDTLIG